MPTKVKGKVAQKVLVTAGAFATERAVVLADYGSHATVYLFGVEQQRLSQFYIGERFETMIINLPDRMYTRLGSEV